MNCAEFQKVLPYIIETGGNTDEEQHLRECRVCSDLVQDLRYIADQTKLLVGPTTLDLIRRQVDDGRGPVPLADREFLLLQELMRHAGRSVSKERLLSSVWGYHFDPGSNVVDVYVRRLRAKLGPDAITTIRGVGYRFDAP